MLTAARVGGLEMVLALTIIEFLLIYLLLFREEDRRKRRKKHTKEGQSIGLGRGKWKNW